MMGHAHLPSTPKLAIKVAATKAKTIHDLPPRIIVLTKPILQEFVIIGCDGVLVAAAIESETK